MGAADLLELSSTYVVSDESALFQNFWYCPFLCPTYMWLEILAPFVGNTKWTPAKLGS